MGFARTLLALTTAVVTLASSPIGAAESRGGLAALVAAEFRADRPGGVVLVARRGVPVLRRAFGLANVELSVRMRADHVFKVASITKEFTAMAVLRLVAEDKIELDDDVRRHLPEFNTHGGTITIEQLLTHTSGLANMVDLEGFDALSRQKHSLTTLLALTQDKPLHFAPGESYRYSDSGYVALAAVVERASGMSFVDYVLRMVRSLGLRETHFLNETSVVPKLVAGYSLRDGAVVQADYMSMSVPHAAGALASTADDLLRWHLALRAGSVVPKPLLARAWAARVLPDGTPSGYGFGFKVCALAGERTVEHGGFINGFLASALQVPARELDVIALVNSDADNPDPGKLSRRIARFVLMGNAELRTAALDDAQRRSLVGTYEVARGNVRKIVERNGSLLFVRAGRPAQQLMALSPTELSTVESEGALVFAFDLGADGRASRMRMTSRCEPVLTARALPL